MSTYNPERMWPRLVPKGSVMVSVFGPDGIHAYCVIANVSEGGACVVGGVHFEPGVRLLLRIGFDPERPFATEAQIVWTRDESDDKRKNYIHGVKFLCSAEQTAELREILNRPGFQPPVLPGALPANPAGLNAMMNDLNEELDELGDKLSQMKEVPEVPEVPK